MLYHIVYREELIKMFRMDELRYKILLLFLILSIYNLYPQEQNRDHFSPWLMPAIVYKPTAKFSLFNQLAYSPYKNSAFLYVLGTYKINNSVTLGGGYFLYTLKNNQNKTYIENDLILSSIFSIPIPLFLIEYRNMNMFIFPENLRMQYYSRNRLRLITQDKLISKNIKPYIYMEEYYNFNEKQWFRSRKGLGVLVKTSENTQLDISYIFQQQRNIRDLHLMFFQFIVTI